MNRSELKVFLDEKADFYEHPSFLESDPIQIPHRFSKKEDVEVSAFLTATIAWGNRKSIINNALKMMTLLGDSPHDFICNHDKKHLPPLEKFVHRTFNGNDLIGFVSGLQHIYKNHGGLEAIFTKHQQKLSLQLAILELKRIFFEVKHLKRSQKHISNPATGSAAKRINMFLRWMVRSNQKQVDFGIWKSLSSAQLSCPLDVHSGNVARKLKLLKRKQNDAKAVAELDKALRKLDANDPIKYDFALFGLGVFERF